MFENRLLRRIFGFKKFEVTAEWGKLLSRELNNLYSSPNIFRRMKSRRRTWAGNVTLIGEWRKVAKILLGNLKKRNHS
jgi:hypothetical protein